MYASALPRVIRLSKTCAEINRKTKKKHPRHYRLLLEERLADFNNFWQKYFVHRWLLNKCFSFNLTQRLLLNYLGISDQA